MSLSSMTAQKKAIKLVTDFVNSVHYEDDRQDLLLSVQRRRDQICGSNTKMELQIAYEAMSSDQMKNRLLNVSPL